MATDWHLQVWDTEWVFWGCGARPPVGFCHIAPAIVRIRMKPGDDDPIEIPFKPPDLTDRGREPSQEYERAQKFGWRFKTNDLCHDTGWELADSRAEAIGAARQYARDFATEYANRDSPDIFVEALNDVRDMGAEVDWIGSVLESS